MSDVWISPIITIDENVRRIVVHTCHTDVHLRKPKMIMSSYRRGGPMFERPVWVLGYTNAIEAGDA